MENQYVIQICQNHANGDVFIKAWSVSETMHAVIETLMINQGVEKIADAFLPASVDTPELYDQLLANVIGQIP